MSPDTPSANAPRLSEKHNVLDEIIQERAAQDAQWGGAFHDDSHDLFEWFIYIDKQIRLGRNTSNPIEYESRMVKIAALAVAAIESSRRHR